MISEFRGGQNIHKYYEEGPKEFRTVPENHFQLKDEGVIQELNTLQRNSKQMENPIQRLGGTTEEQAQYRQRQQQFLSGFDQLVRDQQSDKSYSTPYQNYDYYNLENVKFDEQESMQDAYQFLRELEIRKDPLANQLNKLSLDYKPQYVKKGKTDGMQEENTQKITKKMQLLSFQDDENH